ncbi:folylpolyglutamate synthase [Entomoplasma ellychniae]|uniref:Folylpolyglutamate synthase n=1 Tax=Entomoplasma ellychniae TaxID=2114 RepID=A0A8E2UAX6_9MOLU|nr:Mur ligase family protein [Entomoplasma ellychniae]PPE04845.1 folylpolyglutamate synthase [Entomoplasma ellychniae]
MIQVSKDIIDINQRFQKIYNLDKVLNLLNNPQQNLPTISVVGTNGKGSTSFFISKGLLEKYNKVGLFTSPAFIYHNERIQINNKFISDEDLKHYIKITKKYVVEYKLTFFEIWTLIAILYFADNNVDIIVMEAGIGGVKDSTKLMSNQLLVVVSSISYDHIEVLGTSIEEIIFQKVNIAYKNVPLIISMDNLKYKDIIIKSLVNKNAIIWADSYEDKINYQKANKGLANKVLQHFKINYDLNNVQPPLGRFTQIEFKDIKIILDGAHNVDGINQLINSVNTKEWTVVYASIETKDYITILNTLKNNFEKVYITNFEYFKSWDINKINHNLKIKNIENFILTSKENLLICGSLYFVPLVYEFIIKQK